MRQRKNLANKEKVCLLSEGSHLHGWVLFYAGTRVNSAIINKNSSPPLHSHLWAGSNTKSVDNVDLDATVFDNFTNSMVLIVPIWLSEVH